MPWSSSDRVPTSPTRAALLVFGTAFCYGLYQVLTRKIAAQDSAETTIIYTALVGLVVTSVLVPFNYQIPTHGLDWLVFLAPGFFGGFGHYCLVKAYENGPASAIAPFNYAQLVGSVSLSIIIFSEFPDLWTWMGCGIIVASGLYLMHREAQLGRERARRSTTGQDVRER